MLYDKTVYFSIETAEEYDPKEGLYYVVTNRNLLFKKKYNKSTLDMNDEELVQSKVLKAHNANPITF